jgi:hypothetical protein
MMEAPDIAEPPALALVNAEDGAVLEDPADPVRSASIEAGLERLLEQVRSRRLLLEM